MLYMVKPVYVAQTNQLFNCLAMIAVTVDPLGTLYLFFPFYWNIFTYSAVKSTYSRKTMLPIFLVCHLSWNQEQANKKREMIPILHSNFIQNQQTKLNLDATFTVVQYFNVTPAFIY